MKFVDLTFEEKCAFFARGHRTVGKFADSNLSPRYLPKVGGHFVKLTDMPEFGYLTRDDALAAASRFQESARQWLGRAKSGEA